MAKKKKKKEPLSISITIELPDEPEPQISSVDNFVDTFFRTLSYWVLAFFLIALLGLIF
tara:strand:+ start:4479 stop:4655 length:177 start_codon:yes stop_codon:yes gene_type:complete